MQYHLNGFRSGDPHLRPAAHRASGTVDQGKVDVLIVGCGPAGLTLAAQLSEFGDITTRIIERKPGPMEKGQADGVSCRSMEMFEAFGFAHKVKREAYWVNETVFWSPAPENPAQIARAGRVQDVEYGLSEMPHVILNQARIHDMFLDHMRHAPARLEPVYGVEVTGLKIDTARDASHPVSVTMRDAAGADQTVQARYVVGCDGARSVVRTAIGKTLQGDAVNQVWGVMDVLVVTDFPDIRFKTVVQSDGAGTVLIIPREGGHMVRFYIEHGTLEPGERAADRNITVDELIAKAQRIFAPYTLEIKDVVWWSAYQIGQRLTDKFDNVSNEIDSEHSPRVFIAGDACHTHSPKAGQGMNVSMGDAFNLGWKLKSVLQGDAPTRILHSYSAERQAVAQDLIDFDKHWAQAIRDQGASDDTDTLPPVQRQFIRQGRYTAGVAVKYARSDLTGDPTWQGLAPGFEIGCRFHSAPVVRMADGKPMELGHVIDADGRWRVFVFAPDGELTAPEGALTELCTFLNDAAVSPLHRFGDPAADIDGLIDVRFVVQSPVGAINVTDLPAMMAPTKGRFGLRDYEKTFCATGHDWGDIYNLRRVDRQGGCMVVVRPDQYVGHVLPVNGHAALTRYFDGILQQRDR
jgi:phenol 2-monooxygenase